LDTQKDPIRGQQRYPVIFIWNSGNLLLEYAVASAKLFFVVAYAPKLSNKNSTITLTISYGNIWHHITAFKDIQTVRITTIISLQYSTNTVIGLMVEPRFR